MLECMTVIPSLVNKEGEGVECSLRSLRLSPARPGGLARVPRVS